MANETTFNVFPANLFKWVGSGDTRYTGAPKLVPNNTGDLSNLQSTPTNGANGIKQTVQNTPAINYVVNVHNDYTWTVSDDAKYYVPKIRLIEYKLAQATEINALFQIIRGSAENVLILQNALKSSPEIYTQNRNFLNQLIGLAGQGGTAATDIAQTAFQNFGALGTPLPKNAQDIMEIYKDAFFNPYKNLYTVIPSQWEYVFPYLGSSNMLVNSNEFENYSFKRFTEPIGNFANALGPFLKGAPSGPRSKSKDGGATGNIFELGKSFFELSKTAIAGEPGAIKPETPQSFVGASMDSITVVFYLLNTINPQDVRKNWEFCYLFSYQNLPNRKGINLLDSPHVYSVQIPGYKVMPACYVKDLKIENVGATRMVDIGSVQDGANSNNEILKTEEASSNTIKMIPEAYKITFTLQSMFINSRNIFTTSANPGFKVTVTQSGT